MARIHITDTTGARRTIDAAAHHSLMEALRDTAAAVEGACGGVASCGTCHVYVGKDWMTHLGHIGEDEAAMLEGLGEVMEVRPTSRLACQIPVRDELDGLTLEIALSE